MSLFLFGQILEIVVVLILVLVLSILFRYGQIRYIKDIRMAFNNYMLLIILSAINLFSDYPLIDSLLKYTLLLLAVFFISSASFSTVGRKISKWFYVTFLGMATGVPLITFFINKTQSLEGIGYIFMGISLIVIGSIWFRSVLRHINASRISATLFILLGLHFMSFIVFQYNEEYFVVGYIISTALILLLTFSLVVLNFAIHKEKDDFYNKRYLNLFNNSSDAILLIEKNIIYECNRKAENMFNLAKKNIIGKTPMELSAPVQENGRETNEYGEELFNNASAGKTTRFDWIHLNNLNEEIKCEISLFEISKKEYAAIIRDMSSQFAYESEINFYKYYDAITHLPKRELFIDRLSRCLEEGPEKVALIAFNIDKFKEINDQYGHETGDIILKDISSRVTEVFNNELTLTRLGGDEFVLILDKMLHHNKVYITIEKIQIAFEKFFYIAENPIKVSACIGVAFGDDNEISANELLKNVDLALNLAKSKGRGKLEFYSEDEKEVFTKRITLEKEMKEGLQNKEFIPYYQPIIDAKTGKIIGAEALARWQRTDGSMINPDIFIPIAEETELINAIGEHILHKACSDCKKILASCPTFVMNINISPVQLQSYDIIQILKTVMEEYEITSRHLILEMTETVFIHNYEKTNNIINCIHDMGIRLALDDFGTGYSSLSYLTKMNVDIIKIDRSFVLKLPHDQKARTTMDYLTGLLHNLGYIVIVEGVEEKDQADYIISRDCDSIQGYYYHRPMPYKQLQELMLNEENSN
ncbi:MAG: sensor domain-containing phosphodiesterase [Acidaminobacteraceae bacterium]